MNFMDEIGSYLRDIEGIHCRLSLVACVALHEDSKRVAIAREASKQPDAKALQARDKLIESCLPYAIKIAKSFRGNGIEFGDLISEANMHLINAVEKWNPDRGALTTIVGWSVTRGLIQTLEAQDNRGVRIPESTTKYIKLLKEDIDTLTAEEIAVKTGKPVKRVQEIIQARNALRIASLDARSPRDDDDSNGWHIPIHDSELDEEGFTPKQIQKLLLRVTNKRNVDIFNLSYGIGPYLERQPQKLIIDKHNVCKERIRQICNDVEAKLRVAVKRSLWCRKGKARFMVSKGKKFPFYRHCAGNCGRSILIESKKDNSTHYCQTCPRVKDKERVGIKCCKGCDKFFALTAKNTAQMYCSKKCPGLQVICQKCEKPFFRSNHRPTQAFCSWECSGYRGAFLVPIPCKICEIPFQPKSSRQICCSMRCRHQWIGVKNAQRIKLPSVPCAYCKNYFKKSSARVKYCSRDCAEASRRKYFEKPCEFCKTMYIPRNGARFCSHECYNNSRVPRPNIKCPQCDKEFFPLNHRTKFCSRDCTINSRKAPNKVCEFCQCEYHPMMPDQRFCGRDCYNNYWAANSKTPPRSKTKRGLAPIGTEVSLSECTEHCCVSAGA